MSISAGAFASRRSRNIEQMSWDITTKEKALFETALDGENLSWQESLLESGDFPETEEPDIAARPPHLEEEANSPMNENDGSLVSEPPVAEDEDPNEGERQVEEPDLVTEEFRGFERDHSRRRL